MYVMILIISLINIFLFDVLFWMSEQYRGYMGLGVVSLPWRGLGGTTQTKGRKWLRSDNALTPTQISADDDPFEDKEPIKEEEQHDEEFNGVPTYSLPYPDSSSHDDHADTYEEDTTESELSLEIIAPLSPSSRWSFCS